MRVQRFPRSARVFPIAAETAVSRSEVVERAALSLTFDDGVPERHAELSIVDCRGVCGDSVMDIRRCAKQSNRTRNRPGLQPGNSEQGQDFELGYFAASGDNI